MLCIYRWVYPVKPLARICENLSLFHGFIDASVTLTGNTLSLFLIVISSFYTLYFSLPNPLRNQVPPSHLLKEVDRPICCLTPSKQYCISVGANGV